MLKSISFIFTVLVLFIQCENKSQEADLEDTKITKYENYIIKNEAINTEFPNYLDRGSYLAKSYINGDVKLLYWYHSVSKQITIIDLQNQVNPKRISFTDKELDKRKAIYGYTIQSQDSIYVSTNIPGQISLIDGQGQLINNINFTAVVLGNQSNHYSLLRSIFWTDVYKIDERIIIPLSTAYLEQKPTHDEWKELSLLVTQDDSCSVNLPKLLFNEKNLPVSNNLTTCMLDKQIYFSFNGDHSIFKVKDCDIIKESEVKSEFASKIYGMMELAGFQLCGSFRYGNLHSDPYKNYIYRIAVPSHQDPEMNCMERVMFPLEFSIMVFNPDLELIKEVKVTDKKYSIIHAFVDENGLNLLRSPYHPAYEEEKLTFDAFIF